MRKHVDKADAGAVCGAAFSHASGAALKRHRSERSSQTAVTTASAATVPSPTREGDPPTLESVESQIVVVGTPLDANVLRRPTGTRCPSNSQPLSSLLSMDRADRDAFACLFPALHHGVLYPTAEAFAQHWDGHDHALLCEGEPLIPLEILDAGELPPVSGRDVCQCKGDPTAALMLMTEDLERTRSACMLEHSATPPCLAAVCFYHWFEVLYLGLHERVEADADRRSNAWILYHISLLFATTLMQFLLTGVPGTGLLLPHDLRVSLPSEMGGDDTELWPMTVPHCAEDTPKGICWTSLLAVRQWVATMLMDFVSRCPETLGGMIGVQCNAFAPPLAALICEQCRTSELQWRLFEGSRWVSACAAPPSGPASPPVGMGTEIAQQREEKPATAAAPPPPASQAPNTGSQEAAETSLHSEMSDHLACIDLLLLMLLPPPPAGMGGGGSIQLPSSLRRERALLH